MLPYALTDRLARRRCASMLATRVAGVVAVVVLAAVIGLLAVLLVGR